MNSILNFDEEKSKPHDEDSFHDWIDLDEFVMVNVPFFSRNETNSSWCSLFCKKKKKGTSFNRFSFSFLPAFSISNYSLVIFIPYLKLTEESRKIIYDWHGFR